MPNQITFPVAESLEGNTGTAFEISVQGTLAPTPVVLTKFQPSGIPIPVSLYPAAIYGQSVSGVGVWGNATLGAGVVGVSNGAAPTAAPEGGTGVYGECDNGYGVWGVSKASIGVYGETTGWDAIVGETQSDAHAGATGRNLTTGANGGVGIYGTGGQFAGRFDGAQIGVFSIGASAEGGIGVQGSAFTGVVGLGGGQSLQGLNPEAGVFGLGPTGVCGQGENRGVTGSSPKWAVYGETAGSDGNGTSGIGLYGYGSFHGIGVQGRVGTPGSPQATGIAVLGEAVGGGLAGKFEGNVDVVGTLTKQAGGFKIDHPLDPENRQLQHSFVESPDMMNIYNGMVILDDLGEATVNLPHWFEALNGDFRYQLTCIGGFAPVYIAEEIYERRFRIAGGNPDMKISWQVTGIRHDPYAEKHRIATEVAKPTQRLRNPVLDHAVAA